MPKTQSIGIHGLKKPLNGQKERTNQFFYQSVIQRATGAM
jgi:hypothetical protein